MKHHPHVEEARVYYTEHDPNNEKAAIARKLITNETIRMWQRIFRESRKKYEPYDNLWVIAFIGQAHAAASMRPYHYQSKRERQELIAKIAKHINQLSRTLSNNGLDLHIIHSTGKIFNGFMFYEGFGESNRAKINASGIQKLPITTFLNEVESKTREIIGSAELKSYTVPKAGKGSPAVWFIREMAIYTRRTFETPLNAVLADAANALYGTHYSESDIAQLLGRKRKSPPVRKSNKEKPKR